MHASSRLQAHFDEVPVHRSCPAAAVTDRDGCTPLYCAAAWNRIEAVRLLERLHCPSSLRSLEGRTAVHVAAEQVGQRCASRLLLGAHGQQRLGGSRP